MSKSALRTLVRAVTVEITNRKAKSPLVITVSSTFSRCVTSLLQVKTYVMSWLKWKPTSSFELELAETKLLSYLKSPYQGYYVDIPNDGDLENDRIWTIEMKHQRQGQKRKSSLDNEDNSRRSTNDNERLPLVLVHGFGAGVGIWSLNLDQLCKDRTVYAFDVLGFGRSSRPKINSSTPEDVEWQLVQSIEKWRQAVGLTDKFVLLGHSFGAYIASSYSLQFPDHVAHLVLADPWGVPAHQTAAQSQSNSNYVVPIWVKLVATLVFQTFTPLAALRAAGPWGPTLVQKLRPDIRKKFEGLVGTEDSDLILNYIYHCNAQNNPSGELAFKALALPTGWAKFPVIQRIVGLHADIDLTFIYGSRSWIDRQPAFQIKYLLRDRSVDIHVIQGAGHHIYADKPEQFNALVRQTCVSAEEREIELVLEDKLRDENLHDQD